MAAGVPSAAAVAVLARPTVLGTSVAVAVWGVAVRVAPRLALARERRRRRPLRRRSSIPVMGVGRIVHARLRGPSLGRRCPQRGWSSSRSRRGRRKLVDLLFASFWAGFRRGHLLSESGLAMNFSSSSNSAINSRVARSAQSGWSCGGEASRSGLSTCCRWHKMIAPATRAMPSGGGRSAQPGSARVGDPARWRRASL